MLSFVKSRRKLMTSFTLVSIVYCTISFLWMISYSNNNGTTTISNPTNQESFFNNNNKNDAATTTTTTTKNNNRRITTTTTSIINSQKLSSTTTTKQQQKKKPRLHYTTFKDIVLDYNNSTGCTGQYRNYPLYVQERVNSILGHAMIQQPKHALMYTTPPQLPTNISQGICTKETDVYTGNLYTETTTKTPQLYVGFMFSHEIDLLEIKLYEGLGIVDKYFIGESHYSHRGHRKLMFTDVLFGGNGGGRLSKFQNYVEVVNLDLCEKYNKAIMKYRYADPRPSTIWDTQTLAHECLTDYIRNYTTTTTTTTTTLITQKSTTTTTTTANENINNNDNALVFVSDLDEILYRNTLISIKYCEMKSTIRQNHFPLPVYTTYVQSAKLCPQKPITEYKIPGLLFEAVNITSQRRPAKKKSSRPSYSIQYLGGIHLTYMGGSLVISYKTTNHAECGDLHTLGWINNATYNPTLCEATRYDFYQREMLLCTNKEQVIRPWIKQPPPPPSTSTIKQQQSDHQDYHSNNHQKELLPWILQSKDNHHRYPCFFDNYKDCVDQYIDYMI